MGKKTVVEVFAVGDKFLYYIENADGLVVNFTVNENVFNRLRHAEDLAIQTRHPKNLEPVLKLVSGGE